MDKQNLFKGLEVVPTDSGQDNKFFICRVCDEPVVKRSFVCNKCDVSPTQSVQRHGGTVEWISVRRAVDVNV